MNIQKKNKIILTTICLVALLGITLPHISFAADADSGFQFIPEECLGSQLPGDKPCDLNSFVQLFVNLAQTALKVLPYLAMLMMMWAGFNLITAGGNPEKIQQGKKMVVSVVVGVIIVIFLAWGFAGFVVFALTGDVTIFPDTKAFTKEWWGGGEATAHDPNTGCCYVPNFGCKEVTQEACTALTAGQYGYMEVQFMGENQFCSEFKAQCENYTKGCCVPENNTDKSCYRPDASGCVNWPTTYHSSTACDYLGQDCDPDKIQGAGSADEGATGCCVQPSSCSMTKIGDCPSGGTFLLGQDCSTSTDAKAACDYGCCIGKNSCTKGKNNCTSNLWDPQECNQLTDDCATSCCKLDPGGNKSCYNNTTKLYCFSVLQGVPSASGVECKDEPICTDGCCENTCKDGNIEGSCADLTYNQTSICSANPQCSAVCCLYQNALTCSNDVPTKNCQVPPNTSYGAGACSSRPGCLTGSCRNNTLGDPNRGTCTSPVALDACTFPGVWSPIGTDSGCDIGCCSGIPSDTTCHDSYTRSQCSIAGGTFTAGLCSNVDNCHGCCVQHHDNYNCFEPWTSSRCSADNIANNYYGNGRCWDVTDLATLQKACVTGCCLKRTLISTPPNPDIFQNDCYMSTEIFCTENLPNTTFRANDNSCDNTNTTVGCDGPAQNKLPWP